MNKVWSKTKKDANINKQEYSQKISETEEIYEKNDDAQDIQKNTRLKKQSKKIT